MATSPTLLSKAEYLRTSYQPDVDFVDGEIEERRLGEFEHNTLQIAVGSFFWTRRKEWNIHPVTEQRILVAPNRVRVADVAVLRGDAPREKVIVTPPLVCVEILSPEDRLSRTKVVLADYLAMGVENVWLIDPIYRAAFTFDGAGLHEADSTQLRVAGSAIFLDLTEAFEAID